MLKISNFDLTPLLILAIFIWLIALTLIYWFYVKDKKKILKEIKGKGVENFLRDIFEKNSKIERDIYKLYKASQELNGIATRSISKAAVTRYNPFSDTGGDQSFSIALLDLKDNGLIISSLHSRGGTRIYAKPVIGGQSKYHLTGEEKEAIEKARLIKV